MNDKPKKPRKARVDSVSGVAAAIVAGGKKIAIPKHVSFTPKERLIFTEICGEFSKTELTAHKITLIAHMAKETAALEEQQNLLAREGTVLTNSHGNAVANPGVKVCSQLVHSILAWRRSLGIHTRALEGGDNRNALLRRNHNKANEAMLDEMDPDGLLGRPNVIPITGRKEDDDDDA